MLGEKVVSTCQSDATNVSTDVSSSDAEDMTPQRQLVDIPIEQGMSNLRKVLEKDCANRYQAKEAGLNFNLRSEKYLAKYVGMKYALCLNSGGIAITLGLEGLKRVFFPDDTNDDIRVYSNAFTFNAVPSACVNAGFRNTLHLVETNAELEIDLAHLEQCIQEDLRSGKFSRGKMILVLSYMRAKVPDMHRVLELCKEYEVLLLEDCAHAYGCSYDGQMCGSFGVISTMSFQAAKLVNTGDGGMILTNNDELQAFFIFSAGSYEDLWKKHNEMAPPEEVALKFKFTTVNKSVRLTNIQAALLHPQLMVINDRVKYFNSLYAHLVACTGKRLEETCGEGARKCIFFIGQANELVGPVNDSLQVRLMQPDGTASQKEFPGLDDFLAAIQARKCALTKFSDPSNARNYMSWQFLKAGQIMPDALPLTTGNLCNVCDVRLRCEDTELKMEKWAVDLAECYRDHIWQREFHPPLRVAGPIAGA